MAVLVTLPPVLQALAGGVKNVGVGGGTVGECLEELAARYPQLKTKLFTRRGKLPKGTNIFVNGANVHPEPLARKVNDGDNVHISYLVLGG
jgi:molybdopterin converting factor small subunit